MLAMLIPAIPTPDQGRITPLTLVGVEKGVSCHLVPERRLGSGSSSAGRIVRQTARSGGKVGMRTELIAEKVNWMCAPPDGEIAAGIQIRYNGLPSPGRVIPVDDERVRVTFDEPVRAITPGQAAVWYDGDVVLGGGWIL